jgi:hypothetical protein
LIFPTDFVEIDNGKGCIAVIKKVGGRRREEGPHLAGRPQVEHGNASWKASRLSYHLNEEPLPRTPPKRTEGLVCHTCDNDWCINPDHLYLGTARQNTKDIFNRNERIRPRMLAAKMGNQNRVGCKATPEQNAARSISLLGNQRKKGIKESAESCALKGEKSRAYWDSEAGRARKEKQRAEMMGNSRHPKAGK